MTVPAAEPPLSFALTAWRLAMREACQTCGRPQTLHSLDCPACNALADGLVAEEQSQRAADLRAQVVTWHAAGLLDTATATRLQQAIERREPPLDDGAPPRREAARDTATERADTSEAATAASDAHRPVTPVAARNRRRINWRELGESLLAERTLNTLLGLGAFLILASALVISVVNPTGLALLPHMAVLVGTTVLFYAAGWLCYTRMRLVRAGEALLGIGAGFVPLDVWSVGRADSLAWPAVEVWAIGSALAVPIYLVSYMLLPGRVFAWLVALAGGSLLVSTLARASLPPEWMLCAAMLLAIGYILLSPRLPGQRWDNLRRALFGVAHIAAPPMLLVALAAKVGPDLSGVPDGQLSEYAVGAAWWLGVGLYALSAYQRRRGPFKALAAWLAPVAYLLTLTKTPWDASWYGVCLAGLAAVYAAYALRFEQARPTSPVFQVGLALTLAALVWPAPAGLTWALVAAFAADGLLAFIVAQAARSTSAAFVSVGVLATGYLLALGLWQWADWTPDQPRPWVLLAIALGGTAEALVRRSGEQRRSLTDVVLARGTWKAVFGPAMFDAAYAASIVGVGAALARSPSEPVASSLALTLVAAVAALSAWTRRSSLFLYPASVLLPAAVALGIHAWRAGDAENLTVGLSLSLVGAAYAWLGGRLDSAMGATYRNPLWLIGLSLSVIGPGIAVLSGDPSRQAAVAGVCAALFAATVAIVRRPLWAYPAALWILASFELTVRAVLPDPRPEYVLAALVVPTCLALGLAEIIAARTPRTAAAGWFALAALTRSRWAVPLLVVALVGFTLSLAGSSVDERGGAGVSAIYGVVLAAVALRHGAQPGERWASLILFALAGLHVLAYGRVPLLQRPPYWSAFALLLAVLGLLVRRWQHPAIRAWSMPLLWSATIVEALSEVAALTLLGADSLRTLSVTTGVAGVVLLILATARRGRLLAYGGVATLLGAGLLEAANGRVWQPQVYALTVGMYVMALVWLEWRRGDPARLKAPLELAALLVLLGTTLLQGLGAFGFGLDRYPYDVELIVEGLAVLILGAVLHWWRSLFAGAAAIIAAVLILLAEPLATLNTWYLLGTIGLLMVGVVVLLERRRRQIATWLDAWRERLETWA